jgi:hypothetical protein
VWSTCLTEAERKFLKQFLPSETDAEENVHLLLTGKNHHFGNPFLSWQVLYDLIPIAPFISISRVVDAYSYAFCLL